MAYIYVVIHGYMLYLLYKQQQCHITHTYIQIPNLTEPSANVPNKLLNEIVQVQYTATFKNCISKYMFTVVSQSAESPKLR